MSSSLDVNQVRPYTPGVCNLDRKGVRSRKRQGILYAVIGAVLLVVMYLMNMGLPLRYAEAAIFGGLTVLTLRQAKNKFCVLDGLTGIEETSGNRKEVQAKEDSAKDIQKAGREILVSLLYGLAIGLLGLLPIGQ